MIRTLAFVLGLVQSGVKQFVPATDSGSDTNPEKRTVSHDVHLALRGGGRAMSKNRAHGEGTVTRRKDGRWEARASFGCYKDEEDKEKVYRVRKTVYGATKTEVVAKLRELQIRYAGRLTDLRLDEFLKQWLEDGKKKWRPQTHRTYTYLLQNHVISRAIGKRKIASIDPEDLDAWQRELENADVKPSARKRALTTLRTALEKLVKRRVLRDNPCETVEGPKIEEEPVVIPEPEDITRILDAAEPFWLFTLVVVAFTCSMRQGEVFGLIWSDIDLKKGVIRVTKQLSEDYNGELVRAPLKTKAARRSISLGKTALEILRKHREMQSASGYTGEWVFPSPDEAGPLRKSNFDRRQWHPLLRKARVSHYVFHSLRHFGNSLLIEQGEDIVLVSRRMGHVDGRLVAGRYGHLFEGAERRASENLEPRVKEIVPKKRSADLDESA